MRKLIVSNMTTLDSLYDGVGKDLGGLFAYYPEGDQTIERYDQYNNERTRAADTLLISGRDAFLGSKDFWTKMLTNPDASPTRMEYAKLIRDTNKVVISDKLTTEELGEWTNTRIIRLADAQREIAAMKAQPGRDIFLNVGRILWHDLMAHDLIDELHLAIYPMIGGAGVPLFEGQPGVTLRLLGTRTFTDAGVIIAQYGVSRKK